jgi:Leucine-rich repeat (LRR) protein
MQTYKRHKPVHTPYIPVEIWGFIIELSCYNRGHKYTMFVSWEWFDMTIRSLSNLGMLATRSSALIDLIAKRTALKGLRMTMIGPTQDMIRPEMRLAALKIKTTPGQRDITLDEMTSLEELNVGGSCDKLCTIGISELRDLKRLELSRPRYALEPVACGVVGLSALTSLTHLVLDNVIAEDMIHAIYDMTQLMSLVVTESIGNHRCRFVVGDWLLNMVNLTTLDVPIALAECSALNAIYGMTRLSRLNLSNIPSHDLVRLPVSLKDLTISNAMNAELSSCSRLVRLTIDTSGRYSDVLIERARNITTLEYLTIDGPELRDSGFEMISAMCNLKILDLLKVRVLPDKLVGLKGLRHFSCSLSRANRVTWLTELTNLESLHIRTDLGDNASLECVGLMTNLRELDVQMGLCMEAGSRMESFARLVRLKHLGITYDMGCRERDMGNILEHSSMLTDLRSLVLFVPYVTEADLLGISRATTLEELHIVLSLDKRPEGVGHLLTMPRLKELHTNITSPGWQKARNGYLI